MDCTMYSCKKVSTSKTHENVLDVEFYDGCSHIRAFVDFDKARELAFSILELTGFKPKEEES